MHINFWLGTGTAGASTHSLGHSLTTRCRCKEGKRWEKGHAQRFLAAHQGGTWGQNTDDHDRNRKGSGVPASSGPSLTPGRFSTLLPEGGRAPVCPMAPKPEYCVLPLALSVPTSDGISRPFNLRHVYRHGHLAPPPPLKPRSNPLSPVTSVTSKPILQLALILTWLFSAQEPVTPTGHVICLLLMFWRFLQ